MIIAKLHNKNLEVPYKLKNIGHVITITFFLGYKLKQVYNIR